MIVKIEFDTNVTICVCCGIEPMTKQFLRDFGGVSNR